MPSPSDWNAAVLRGITLVTSLRQRSGTIGTTAAALEADSIPVKWIVLMADDDNTGGIFWGASDVANTGSLAGGRLIAGRAVTIPIDDLNKVFIVGSAADQTYRYVAGRE